MFVCKIFCNNHQFYCLFLGPHGTAFISTSSQVSDLQLCLQEQEGPASAHDDTYQREAISLQALWAKVGVPYISNHMYDKYAWPIVTDLIFVFFFSLIPQVQSKRPSKISHGASPQSGKSHSEESHCHISANHHSQQWRGSPGHTAV